MSNLFTKLKVEPGASMKLGDMIHWLSPFPSTRGDSAEIQPRTVGCDPWQLPDLHQEFLVRPGSRVKLGEIDPGYRGRYESP